MQTKKFNIGLKIFSTTVYLTVQKRFIQKTWFIGEIFKICKPSPSPPPKKEKENIDNIKKTTFNNQG